MAAGMGRSASMTSAVVSSEPGTVADARERVPRQARLPVLDVLRIAPAGSQKGSLPLPKR